MTQTLYNAYLKLLRECIMLKSISTDPEFTAEMQKTADWFHHQFINNGFTSELVEGFGNPIVLASFIVNKQAPTILVYGHYDVQPAAKDDGWSIDPFHLTEHNGRLVGRGIVDNKGQVLIHIATIFHLIQTKSLTSNVIFMIEGNEETGSPLLESFVRAHASKLTSDYILISDGETIADYPVIEAGFRGVVNATITLRTLKTDVHSGLMGGVAPSAAHEGARLIATFHDAQNRVCVLGFYDHVVEPTVPQLKNNSAIPFSLDDYEKITGSKHVFSESKYDIYTQTGLRPALEVTGLFAGYTGVGYRNSIPGTCLIKLNARLVDGQKPEDLQKALERHVKKHLPSYVSYTIEFSESAPAVTIDTFDPIFGTISTILSTVSGKKVLYKYVGGSIPIVATFKEVLRKPVLSVPLANDDCNMHGADENFQTDYIKRGLDFSKHLFSTQIL